MSMTAEEFVGKVEGGITRIRRMAMRLRRRTGRRA